jgi:hypothetical protein
VSEAAAAAAAAVAAAATAAAAAAASSAVNVVMIQPLETKNMAPHADHLHAFVVQSQVVTCTTPASLPVGATQILFYCQDVTEQPLLWIMCPAGVRGASRTSAHIT